MTIIDDYQKVLLAFFLGLIVVGMGFVDANSYIENIRIQNS